MRTVKNSSLSEAAPLLTVAANAAQCPARVVAPSAMQACTVGVALAAITRIVVAVAKRTDAAEPTLPGFAEDRAGIAKRTILHVGNVGADGPAPTAVRLVLE